MFSHVLESNSFLDLELETHERLERFYVNKVWIIENIHIVIMKLTHSSSNDLFIKHLLAIYCRLWKSLH